MLKIIKQCNVPRVLLRYIMMNFLDMQSLRILILTVKELNVLDDYSKDFLTDAKKGCIWNCKINNRAVIKWLINVDNALSVVDNEFGNEIFCLVCRRGMLDVAQQIYSAKVINIDTKKFNCAFSAVCYAGHFDVAQWLDSIMDVKMHIIYNCNALPNACNQGHLELAKWLLDRFTISNNDIIDIFRSVCYNGQLEVAKWWYEMNHQCINLSQIVNESYIGHKTLFNSVVYNHHISMAQWLVSNTKIEKNQITDLLKKACVSGDLIMAKWLILLLKHDDDINSIIDEYIINPICKNGHLDILQWLYSLGIRIEPATAFCCSCKGGSIDYKSGHSDVAQWIYSTFGKECLAGSNPFNRVCLNGNFDTAKWLYSINPHDTELYVNSFENACNSGNLELVKWLWDIVKAFFVRYHGKNKLESIKSASTYRIRQWLNDLVD